MHIRVGLAPDEFRKPDSKSWLLEDFEKLSSVKRINFLILYNNGAELTDLRIASSSSLGTGFESASSASSEVRSP